MTVQTEGPNTDAVVETVLRGNELDLYLQATDARPCFVKLFWKTKAPAEVYVLGDMFERSYGDLQFLPLKQNDRAMAWYFMATDKTNSFCLGVKTQPSAFVSFRFTEKGISALADCRNGACGVQLNGRKLLLCTFIFKTYTAEEPFACLCDFCKAMCPQPRLPAAPVYGGNDWYYAYGHNSAKSVASDARLQAEFAKGLTPPPYMVADDGWQQGETAGPWLPNEKFMDMKAVCDSIKAAGVIPGIWMRPLLTEQKMPPELMLLRDGKREYMDPSHPEVLKKVTEDITRIRGWGFRLLKHDYSTYDIFGSWGLELTDTITNRTDWHFYDRTKTSAEIVLAFYRTIRAAAGDMLIIGCNTVSHLCAGIVELNRTGDDTSGKEWARTLNMGVNTLAFRLAQNGAFYIVDADCVGMLEDRVPWEKNRQWLQLLAKSNTALFISCNSATPEQTADIRAAYADAVIPHKIRPLDWLTNKTPAVWEIDGETVRFNWD